MKDKVRDKLFGAYYRTESALVELRDKEYPPGTKVKWGFPNWEATVKEGSLYPHQVNTDMGHLSWHRLEIINDSNDE